LNICIYVAIDSVCCCLTKHRWARKLLRPQT